jgi:hypothetical protein
MSEYQPVHLPCDALIHKCEEPAILRPDFAD